MSVGLITSGSYALEIILWVTPGQSSTTYTTGPINWDATASVVKTKLVTAASVLSSTDIEVVRSGDGTTRQALRSNSII